MQKELQRVTELEIKNEQQQKLLRRKNEEIASAKRRLRNGNTGTLPPINGYVYLVLYRVNFPQIIKYFPFYLQK